MKNTKKSANKKSTKKSNKTVERNRLNQQLFIVPTVEENPRREGSHGYKSMDVILNARKPMAIEAFVKKGGRLRDLHWDITAGSVKLVKKAS